jgi:hypothetical protein
LRVRTFPDEVRVRKMSWSAGALPTFTFVLCSVWIVLRLWNFFNLALAPNGPNPRQPWAVTIAVITGLALPAAAVGGVAIYQVVRWCSRLDSYWELIVQPDLWQLQGLFGLKSYGRVLPDLVRDLVISRDGQVMAVLGDDCWEPVSGPQAPRDAGWLQNTLAGLINKPTKAPASVVQEEIVSAPATKPPEPLAESVDWPAPAPATANEVLPPSFVHNEPGERLRYRLLPPPAERNPAVTCLIVMGIVFLGVPFLWLLTLFVKLVAEPLGVPWLGGAVVLGLTVCGLIFGARQRLFRTIHEPRIEISEHPLAAGAGCQAHLFQRGPLAVTFARVLLVCEEKARYTDGTMTRWATEQVYARELWREDALELTRAAPLAREFAVAVPVAAMRSFQSGHNFVTWKLRVEERIPGMWKPWRHEFPIIIQPAPAPEVRS